MIGHVVHGAGSARVLVLHGWLGDWSVFQAMTPALDPDAFTFAFLDVRGYGRSKDQAGPYDMAMIASDAAALADALGWETFAVVGHSMGGKAALRLAVDHPARVERILALTPVWAGAAPFDAPTRGLFFGAVQDRSLRAAIIDNTTGGRHPKAWSRAMAERSAADSTDAAFEAYARSWIDDDFEAAARTIGQEVLVVVGRHDAGVTEDAVRATWLAQLPSARLEVLDGAGHYPMIETPLALAGIFERFLSKDG